jgi:hypothetical protein
LPQDTYTARARRLREHEIAAVADWERRKAEQAGRMAAAMADPVASFYLRHGWRAEAAAEAPTPCAPADPGGEPDTALWGARPLAEQRRSKISKDTYLRALPRRAGVCILPEPGRGPALA